MTYRPRVVKRETRRIPYLVVVPLSILLLTGGIYLSFYLKNLSEVESTPPFTVCQRSLLETRQLFSSMSFQESYEIKDVLIYGETLNLYKEPYQITSTDPMIGKTVILKNLCDGYEWVYMLEKSVDRQIPLELLPEGFYEVYVVEDLVKKRLMSDRLIHEVFYPVRRSNQSTEIVIQANKELVLDGNGNSILNKNYLFIEVNQDQASIESEDIYDVYIDAAHSTGSGNSVEKGRVANNMIEANETLRMALALKEELEILGLKVLLSRDDTEEIIDLYGVDGRLFKAYQSQAKYYIELNMNYSTNPNMQGSRITYSSFASKKFATAIFKSYSEVEGIIAFGNASNGNIAGVAPVSRFNNLDSSPVIRESGGRILSAGTISDLAITENSAFNSNATQGIQSISFDMIFISNATDATFYSNNLRVLAQAISGGFSKYLDLEKQP